MLEPTHVPAMLANSTREDSLRRPRGSLTVLDCYATVGGCDRVAPGLGVARLVDNLTKLNNILAVLSKWKKLHRPVHRLTLFCCSGIDVFTGYPLGVQFSFDDADRGGSPPSGCMSVCDRGAYSSVWQMRPRPVLRKGREPNVCRIRAWNKAHPVRKDRLFEEGIWGALGKCGRRISRLKTSRARSRIWGWMSS